MAYLATQETTEQVVGIDGIEKALIEYAQEQSTLNIQKITSTDDNDNNNNKFEYYSGTKTLLLKGDFFDLDEKATNGRFDAIWDRASLVAIQPNLREAYVNVISKLIQPGGKILLCTIERRTGDEDIISKGPPFSIPEKEIRRLYETQDWVESITLLEEIDEFARDPTSKSKYEGITSMYELYFLIQAK